MVNSERDRRPFYLLTSQITQVFTAAEYLRCTPDEIVDWAVDGYLTLRGNASGQWVEIRTAREGVWHVMMRDEEGERQFEEMQRRRLGRERRLWSAVISLAVVLLVAIVVFAFVLDAAK